MISYLAYIACFAFCGYFSWKMIESIVSNEYTLSSQSDAQQFKRTVKLGVGALMAGLSTTFLMLCTINLIASF